MVSPILLSIPLHDSTIFRANYDSEHSVCHAEAYNVAIYLIVALVIMVIPTFIILLHYSFLAHKVYYLYEYEKKAQTDGDVELHSVTNVPSISIDKMTGSASNLGNLANLGDGLSSYLP